MKLILSLLATVLIALLSAACTTSPTTSPTAPPITATEIPSAPMASSSTTESGAIVVFAAASLTEPFSDIGTLFEQQHTGVTVTFNFAGSQQLAQQLGQDAPADVFASANYTQMDVAVEASRVMTETAQPFVRNRLVVIYPADTPGTISTLQDLATPGLKLVLAAAEVPVGQYSLDFLDKATPDTGFASSFKDDVLANVVSYEDNVKAVLSKVALGEADAGIVYSSDVSADSATRVGQIEIPDTLNTIARYPIAPTRDSAHPDLTRDFIDLVLSPDGQSILEKYGFIPIE